MKNNRSTILLGIIIILLGGIILFNNFGLTETSVGEIFRTYWPVLLIIWGIDNLFKREYLKTKGQTIFYSVVLIIGLIILGRNMGLYNLDLSLFWKSIWPILIIVFGISLLRGARKTHSSGLALMDGIEIKGI